MGHEISEDGVTMYQEKITAVQDWLLPRTLRALRGFLSLIGYYCKFIHNYGIIAAPLTTLLKKEGFH